MIPGIPNPTYSATVGSITTHPHYCDWCHKQYASKAKLLQHQRKKHPDNMVVINHSARARQRASTPAPTSVPSSIATATSLAGSTSVTLGNGVATTNLITILGNLNSIITATMSTNDLSPSAATSADLQELLQSNPATNDLLTQAMSELTATTQAKGDGGATIIITAPANDASWAHALE